jgi:hypothetical protein
MSQERDRTMPGSDRDRKLSGEIGDRRKFFTCFEKT